MNDRGKCKYASNHNIDTNGSNSLLKDTDSQIEWKTRSAIYF